MSNQRSDQGMLSSMKAADRHRLLGEISMLMLNSKLHRTYRINDIGSLILPAIDFNQFRLYKQGDEPIGLMTWAFLSRDIEDKLIQDNYMLQYQDWKSGDQAWVIDFLAPFGHAKEILKDLKNNVFPNQTAKSLRVDKHQRFRGVKTWHGRDVARSFRSNESV